MTVDVAPTAALLGEVFPEGGVGDPAYLRWLYADSPHGEVVEANLDDDRGRAGHYAVVPIDLVADGAARRGALSLNTAVHERARGGGTFVRLAQATYAAAGERGITDVVGVANANSTPGFVRRLGFTLVAPLPAAVLLPRPGRGPRVRSVPATGPQAWDGVDLTPLLAPPAQGLARAWTPEALRWRLAAPGRSYVLHHAPGVSAVSTVDRSKRVPVAVLLKVLAAGPVGPAARTALVRAACRHHRAPVALHVGFQDQAPFRGVALPARLRPSPLNFIHRDLEGGPAAARIARWELLDFDAY